MWSLAVLASLQVAAAQDSTLPKPVDDASQSQKVEGTADEYLQAFEDFVQKFHKHYDSAEEKDRRLKIFSKNMAWVRQRNSEDHNYTVGITPFADLSPGEFRDIYGMQTKNLSAIWGGLPQVQEPQGLLRGILSGAPDSVDWRSKGAVSVVQQQGHCGACWTFATAGAIEGAWKVAGGNLYTLSEQQLLDCAATDYGNMGCKGGNPMNGFTYVRDKGLCTARSYNYKAVQGSCEASRCEQVIPPGGVRGYMQVAQLSENALMQAVAQQPVAVAIDGDSLVFQLYTGGILGGDCGAKLDHGVLLIGYGSSGGQNYWIIKNSWGVQWGENGFGRLARGVGGSGECGILSDASYAVLDKGKVVPGTVDPDPGTVAALLFALLCACCVAVFIYTQFCKRRQRRDPLLSQPTPQAPSTRVMPNPWARQAVTPSAQQAVTPSVQRGVMTPSAPTPSGSIVAQPVAAQPPADAQARTGNSAQSRLLQNK